MVKHSQDPRGYRTGDKVRVRAGGNVGKRGIIRSAQDVSLTIETGDGETLNVDMSEVTNYSLAARRAWQVAPKRAGRPPSESSRKKMVSLRVDVDVWKGLSRAAEFGLIPSREHAVNQWLREHLDALLETGQIGEAEGPMLIIQRDRDGEVVGG